MYQVEKTKIGEFSKVDNNYVYWEIMSSQINEINPEKHLTIKTSGKMLLNNIVRFKKAKKDKKL